MAEENLVSGRSKRSTAGNRYKAALAEFALEDLSKEDPEEDKDFVVETFEEDAFESDFESTDEEEAAAGEHDVAENEDKQARKAARTKLERATAAAQARQKITFDPSAMAADPSTSSSKRKRRVSLGLAIDAHTGEIIANNDDDDQDDTAKKRSSRRQTTIQNTTDTVKRYLKSEEKKASQPRKRFKNTQKLTQAELIARALDTEEGNVVAHRDYLMLEEEKRNMRAKRDKIAVSGPLLRWISKAEEIEVEEFEEMKQPAAPVGYAYSQYMYAISSAYAQQQGYTPQSSLPMSAAASTTANVVSPTTSTIPAVAGTPAATTSSTYLQLYNPSPAPTSSESTSLPYLQLFPVPNTVYPAPPLTSASVPSSSAPAPTSSSSASLPHLQLFPVPNTVYPVPVPPLTSTSVPSSSAPAPASTSSSSASLPHLQLFPVPSTVYPAPPPPPPTSTSVPFSSSSSSIVAAPVQSFAWQASGPTPTLVMKTKKEKVAKSYLVHELMSADQLDSDDRGTKPDWESTMEAMFGDHVRWKEVMVYTGKNRPLSRYVPTCPISGITAKYLDPRTGVPFANVDAYKVLTRLRKGLIDGDDDESQEGVAWDEELGCYVGDFAEGEWGKGTANQDAVVIDLTV